MRKSSRLESDDGDGVQMFAAPLHSDGQFLYQNPHKAFGI